MSADIVSLIKLGESENQELFSGRTHLETVAKSICGMLNQQGGVIYWGVDKSGKVTGVSNAESLVSELRSAVALGMRPSPLFSASVSKVSGQTIIVVDVPRGADKPYSFNREILVRLGKATFQASSEHSASMVQQSAADLQRWERELIPGFDVDDCDFEELGAAKTEIERSGRFGISVPEESDDLLRSLGLEHRGQLTNASAVLFAREPRLWSPNWTLRVVSYSDEKTGPIASDRILTGPAARTLREAVTIIQQQSGFSGKFESGRLERVDKPAYSLFSLREGLVNAIVHRDYTVLGGDVLVEIFPDHLVIQNPGKLPDNWTTADLKKKHASRPKNPDIARVFYLRGLMEQLGMGTQKLIDECKAIGAKRPIWKVEQGSVLLTLFRTQRPTIEVDLSERQKRFLDSTRHGHEYKPSDYTMVTGVSERQSRRELGELLSYGLFTIDPRAANAPF